MMATFVTLIIMGMLLQGVIAVLDSILDVAGVGGMLKGIPVIGANLSLIWAYLFVVITTIEACLCSGLNNGDCGDLTHPRQSVLAPDAKITKVPSLQWGQKVWLAAQQSIRRDVVIYAIERIVHERHQA